MYSDVTMFNVVKGSLDGVWMVSYQACLDACLAAVECQAIFYNEGDTRKCWTYLGFMFFDDESDLDDFSGGIYTIIKKGEFSVDQPMIIQLLCIF